jgi:hypothetical protein
MRIIREFPFTEHIKASLFSWNGKYILKLESGMLEQTYKIPEMEVSSELELLEFCGKEKFKESVRRVFSQMEESWALDL